MIPSFYVAGRMLLCVRERSFSDKRNHSSLQRQFSSGHGQKIDDSGSGSATRISHFLPTSRRIVQFSNGRV
jgi:ethanolamine-phosphate cytidylyltransferase